MIKMKIAIMTQPLGHNYGGIMQAWALQKILRDKGHEVCTINRQPDRHSLLYTLSRYGYRAAMKATGQRKEPIHLEKYAPHRLQNTRRFISEKIIMSEKISSTDDLKTHFDHQEYDAVVVGSDQIWRPKFSPNIDNFFLDFLESKKIKRIAYAASFGVDEWEFTKRQTKRYANLAKQFNGISVREKSGVDLCSAFFNVDAHHVLDPTLLLKKSTYENLIEKKILGVKKEGIFAYFLDQSPEKSILVEGLKKEMGEPILQFPLGWNFSGDGLRTIYNPVLPDPAMWLAGFANSKYIITDSFHGVIFSIIFDKPFVVLNNPSRGTARFSSILHTINEEERLVNETTADEKRISSILTAKTSSWVYPVNESHEFLNNMLN